MMWSSRLVLALAALAVLPLSAAQDDEQIHVVLPRDAIPAIDNPEFEPIEKARRMMDDDEIVIGLVGEREQRAYSTWQLDHHEIVNDAFEGKPIAVTWCPLCGTGIVYARSVAQRTLAFGVSGMLYKDGLVMYDRETNTLWTHVDGRAVRGALAGHQLEMLPSVHATWKEWRTLYPQSLVLKKQRGDIQSPYEDYNRDPSAMGILGRRNPDKRLPPKERIIGVRAEKTEMAFPVKAVRDARLVHAQVGDQPVVLVAAQRDLPVLVFDRRVGSRVLQFRLDVVDRQTVLHDQDTGTTWDLATGKATTGELAGTRLRRANAVPAFWFGWRSYFPFSELWTSPAASKKR